MCPNRKFLRARLSPERLRRTGDADPDEHLLWVVRDRRYKYVQFADPDLAPMLFDLRADPGEFEDLAGKPEW